MPAYSAYPGTKTKLLVPSVVEYLFGSIQDDVALTKMQVTAVTIATDVVTLNVYVRAGNIPVVGQLVSVSGTQTSSGAANIVQAVLTGVTIDANSGIGTITYAQTASNVTKTADAGLAEVTEPEVAETLVDGASVVATMQYSNPDPGGNSRTVTAVVKFPVIPVTITGVTLQSALKWDDPNEWADEVTVATVATSTVTGGLAKITLDGGKFYRFNVSGLNGSGTIIAKLMA